MEKAIFKGDLSSPDPIPDEGIAAATALMNDGRLFRYGEDRNSLPEAAMLEEEFATVILYARSYPRYDRCHGRLQKA